MKMTVGADKAWHSNSTHTVVHITACELHSALAMLCALQKFSRVEVTVWGFVFPSPENDDFTCLVDISPPIPLLDEFCTIGLLFLVT